MDWTEDIRQRLLAPFLPEEVEFLPRNPKDGRALACPHVDARVVMNRLDAVVGPDGWDFDFDVISPDGKKVKGRLVVLGIAKHDAGEASAEEEPLKAAVSDALKRCAVHFGIARHLYCLPPVWCAYDAAKRRFTEPPRISMDAVEQALRMCGYTGAAAPVSDTRPAPPQQTPAPADDTRDLGKHLLLLYEQVYGNNQPKDKMRADLAFLCEKTDGGPLTADQATTGIKALKALIAEGDRAEAEAVNTTELDAPLVVPCTFPSCTVKMTPSDAALSQKVHKSALCAKHSTMARAGMGG